MARVAALLGAHGWSGMRTMDGQQFSRRRIAGRAGIFVAIALVASAGVALLVSRGGTKEAAVDISSQARRPAEIFYPTPEQWATMDVATVGSRLFRQELVTDGKIVVDEDRSTPIYSAYSGRVIKLLVKPGDIVERGQLLFTIEATDTVQAQNDFIAASNTVNKSRSQVNLAQTVETRQRNLYEGKATPLKDWQQAQADLVSAQSDMRSAETALEAASNRLLILGKTEQDISALRQDGKITAETPFFAPIAGTIVQRKVGPGQYLTAGASDPVFVIGDLSTVWLLANVRETDVGKVSLDQHLEFRTLASPQKRISGRVNYVATSVDPNTRRLPVRATINNSNLALKPEMITSVSIFSSDSTTSAAVPRAALLYEGDNTRLWVVTADNGAVLRSVTTGLVDGNLVQITSGLQAGERVIVKGTIFIDRMAGSGQT